MQPVQDTIEDRGQDGPWSIDPRTIALVVAGAVLLFALFALLAVIEFPTREQQAREQLESQQSAGDAQSGQGQPGQAGQGGQGGLGGSGNGSINVQPIPNCPGGFAINDQIYVVPDPEACGLQRVPPGDRAIDPNGRIILVPDPNGNVGGFRIDENGSVELLPPGALGEDAYRLDLGPDGTFDLTRPDGSGIEIAPGDDGLSLRDRLGGGSEFVPGGPGQAPGAGDIPLFQDPPGAQGSPDNSEDRQRDLDLDNDDRDDSDTDSSIPWGTLLLILAAIAAAAMLAYGAKQGWFRRQPTPNEGLFDDLAEEEVEPLDYSVEINALDQLLWEIDQEPDPRTAIRRVYAALETGLENPSLARKRSETPGIFLRRILGHFDELTNPLRDLTSLFEQARFSEHEITPAMRDRAVSNLVQVRNHYAYRMAEHEAEIERQRQLAETLA